MGVKAHLRATFFVLSAVLGKILTVDNLRKRERIIDGWCCLCKSSENQWTNHYPHSSCLGAMGLAIFTFWGAMGDAMVIKLLA
jgi:hypothetical protein